MMGQDKMRSNSMLGQQKMPAQASALHQGDGYATALVAKRVPEVPEQLSRLANAVERAEQSLSELSDRLESVTRPSEPAPATGQQLASVGPCTSTGMGIATWVQRVDWINERMRNLADRLEV